MPYFKYHTVIWATAGKSCSGFENFLKMADETVDSDQIQQRPHKRKHTHDLQSKNRKKWKLPHARGQVKREKSQSVHLGFPKTAAEMSSNWKILQAVSFLIINMSSSRTGFLKYSMIGNIKYF